MKLIKAAWCCLLLLGVMGTAAAQSQGHSKAQYASLLVTGSVEVNPDGSLHGYALDEPEKLPPVVVDVLGKDLPHWSFAITAPTTEVLKGRMALRVLVASVPDGQYKVWVAGASFDGNDGNTGDYVSFKSRSPGPDDKYFKGYGGPRAGVGASVYALLRIGRNGRVEDVFVERVNVDRDRLPTLDKEERRQGFAGFAHEALRYWTFNPPTKGKDVDNPYWVVRVSLRFSQFDAYEPPEDHSYGTWQKYYPGPRRSPSWASKDLLGEEPDAMPDDGLHTGNAGFRLITPLGA